MRRIVAQLAGLRPQVINTATFAMLFRKQFEPCKVKAGETFLEQVQAQIGAAGQFSVGASIRPQRDIARGWSCFIALLQTRSLEIPATADAPSRTSRVASIGELEILSISSG
ncbi:MAG: hypothetical protein ACKVQT_20635 [Burkholderiales bacterium]